MREVMTDKARLCMGEMKETCEESGIQLNTSVRYSPESNWVAERTKRSVGQCSAATYVHNRTPTKALGGRTPYEVLSTMDRNRYLRAFGVPSAIVEPNGLPLSSRMYFFVGYEYSGVVGPETASCRVQALSSLRPLPSAQLNAQRTSPATARHQ